LLFHYYTILPYWCIKPLIPCFPLTLRKSKNYRVSGGSDL
jgi:hypothetical protein